MSLTLRTTCLLPVLMLALDAPAVAVGPEDFTTGPLIEGFGPNAEIETTMVIPAGAVFRHSFDYAVAAEPGELNRGLVSAARFLNMHARAGLAPENMHLAIVLHGTAVHDVVTQDRYSDWRDGQENANIALVEALMAHGVDFYICGQSAAYYDVGTEDLLDGVEMALSAMTVHALLQQDGYTLNPF